MIRMFKLAGLCGFLGMLPVTASGPLTGLHSAIRMITETADPQVFVDLVGTAAQAYRRNDTGTRLPFPGSDGDARGFALVRRATLEDGKQYPQVLQTHPRWSRGGRIQGSYRITLAANQRFQAKLGFVAGAQGTDGVWVNRSGEYILSNQPGFNPNTGSTAEWRRMQRTP